MSKLDFFFLISLTWARLSCDYYFQHFGDWGAPSFAPFGTFYWIQSSRTVNSSRLKADPWFKTHFDFKCPKHLTSEHALTRVLFVWYGAMTLTINSSGTWFCRSTNGIISLLIWKDPSLLSMKGKTTWFSRVPLFLSMQVSYSFPGQLLERFQIFRIDHTRLLLWLASPASSCWMLFQIFRGLFLFFIC